MTNQIKFELNPIKNLITHNGFVYSVKILIIAYKKTGLEWIPIQLISINLALFFYFKSMLSVKKTGRPNGAKKLKF